MPTVGLVASTRWTGAHSRMAPRGQSIRTEYRGRGGGGQGRRGRARLPCPPGQSTHSLRGFLSAEVTSRRTVSAGHPALTDRGFSLQGAGQPSEASSLRDEIALHGSRSGVCCKVTLPSALAPVWACLLIVGRVEGRVTDGRAAREASARGRPCRRCRVWVRAGQQLAQAEAGGACTAKLSARGEVPEAGRLQSGWGGGAHSQGQGCGGRGL